MNLLKFLAENWDSVLAVVAVVAVSIFGAGKRWRNVLKPVLFGLVTWAEREYGPGTGALKLAAVIEKFYPHKGNGGASDDTNDGAERCDSADGDGNDSKIDGAKFLLENGDKLRYTDTVTRGSFENLSEILHF